jgi:hypothetical protein
MVNWTMLSQLTDVFRNLLAHVLPKVRGPRRWVFFDLADPAKRPAKDLLEILRLISRYEKRARVILGMNLGEARQVAGVLQLGAIDETFGAVTNAATHIRDALGIDTVVIHPIGFAAAADVAGTAHVKGPICRKPKITTGAGDHFNAGFCVGRIRGLGLAECLQIGVATSGYYVRSVKSPTMKELVRYLRTL